MDAQLITRIVVSIVAIFNLLAAQFGWNPFDADESDIYLVVSTIFMIVMFVRGFWKNNNFTEAAKLAQDVLDEIKLDQKLYKLEQKKSSNTNVNVEDVKNDDASL